MSIMGVPYTDMLDQSLDVRLTLRRHLSLCFESHGSASTVTDRLLQRIAWGCVVCAGVHTLPARLNLVGTGTRLQELLHPETLVGLSRALQGEELVLHNPFLVRLHPSLDDPTHPNHMRVLGVIHRTEQGLIIDLEVVNLDDSQRVRHAHRAPPDSGQVTDS